MTLVAGVDSSTQSCKVVIREAETGRLVRSGRAAHPPGTEVHPEVWRSALRAAFADAGGLADVAAISVAGQQHATGALHGLTTATASPANIARAAVEGMLCGIAAGLEALTAQGISINVVRLTGGAAALAAVREIAPTVFGVRVLAPEPGEYVADGAARQAAWALRGGAEAPEWPESATPVRRYEAPAADAVRERYRAAQSKYLER
ncbi:FGGY-family carbohydrate kinase [Nocardia sp. IFM 10818]